MNGKGGPARKAAFSAMTRPRQPTLRLLSLNVNGLQDKDKRRPLGARQMEHHPPPGDLPSQP